MPLVAHTRKHDEQVRAFDEYAHDAKRNPFQLRKPVNLHVFELESNDLPTTN